MFEHKDSKGTPLVPGDFTRTVRNFKVSLLKVMYVHAKDSYITVKWPSGNIGRINSHATEKVEPEDLI